MNKQREFSLSYYFEELRKYRKGPRGFSEETFSTTTSVAVLKTLKGAEEEKLTLTALARATKLKIASCQEVVDHLGDEGLVEIERDEETGNDLIALTSKGRDLL